MNDVHTQPATHITYLQMNKELNIQTYSLSFYTQPIHKEMKCAELIRSSQRHCMRVAYMCPGQTVNSNAFNMSLQKRAVKHIAIYPYVQLYPY
jgi:hypothetical protein